MFKICKNRISFAGHGANDGLEVLNLNYGQS